MTTVGWWDCGSGASGDMVLGALVDAGVPVELLQGAVTATTAGRVRLSTGTVARGGVTAASVRVEFEPQGDHRRWGELRDAVAAAGLDPAVRDTALAVFQRLADAEARVHRVPVDDVVFHELGALDTLADVVGAAAGLVALNAHRYAASPVTLGGGAATSAHGPLPVPAPATVEILRAAGAPVRGGDVDAELCTPTGAAILAATVHEWGPLPPMRVTAVGTGAGARELADRANVLRLVVGEQDTSPAESEAVVLAANVDDLDPRLWPTVLDRLLAAGASDAWLTPILMKKGRPAHTLSVLVAPGLVDAVRGVVFRETSTIGMRASSVRKHALDRVEHRIEVDGQPVRVKVACDDGRVVNAAPEYDDVVAAAAALGRPVKAVLAAAIAAVSRDGPVPGR